MKENQNYNPKVIKIMKDVQNMKDTRNIAIDRVGIKDLVVPILVQQKNKQQQPVTAKVNIFVDLPSNKKGTHMSRFVEIIEDFRNTPISISVIRQILRTIKQRLEAKTAYIEVCFTYFIEKVAPVSRKKALMNYQCEISSMLNGEKSNYIVKVKVPVSSLCPCSKEISKYGAHNQRGTISAEISTNEFIAFEDLISLIESNGSCEVYPLLKRVDEKFVTEKAYENPKFVEDITRDVGIRLSSCKKILGFKVSCENYESIHNHNAFAEITIKQGAK